MSLRLPERRESGPGHILTFAGLTAGRSHLQTPTALFVLPARFRRAPNMASPVGTARARLPYEVPRLSMRGSTLAPPQACRLR